MFSAHLYKKGLWIIRPAPHNTERAEETFSAIQEQLDCVDSTCVACGGAAPKLG